MNDRATSQRTIWNVAASVFAAATLCLLVVGCGRSGDGEEPAASTTTTLLVTTLPRTSSTVAVTETTVPQQLTYVVQAGDSLSKIAQTFEIPMQELADFNAIADPNSIKVGQELNIPPVATASEASDQEATTSSTSGG